MAEPLHDDRHRRFAVHLTDGSVGYAWATSPVEALVALDLAADQSLVTYVEVDGVIVRGQGPDRNVEPPDDAGWYRLAGIVDDLTAARIDRLELERRACARCYHYLPHVEAGDLGTEPAGSCRFCPSCDLAAAFGERASIPVDELGGDTLAVLAAAGGVATDPPAMTETELRAYWGDR